MIMSDLPLDLLEEILSRVPATSLKSIRSTCKRWNTLFEDQSFTEKHFRKAPKQPLVLLLKGNRCCSMNVAPPSIEFKGPLGLNDSYSNLKQVDILEVSHCDGLLLCTTKDNRLVVWNPCLGKTRWIQHKTGMEYCKLALGYVNNKSYHSYKILRCSDDCYLPKGAKVVRFEIYEFSSGSWRVLDEDINLDCFIMSISVSLKGNTYWRATDIKDHYELLLNFDFTTERFRRMCLPPIQNDLYFALSVVREEKLSVLQLSSLTSKIEIWVTNKFDTEVALQWTKSFTMDIPIHGKFPSCLDSFVMDEEKKVAFCCNKSFVIHGKFPSWFDSNKRLENMVYIIGEDYKYHRKIPYPEYTKESWWLDEHFVEPFSNKPFIFNYFPSLVQVQHGSGKRKD